MIGTDRVAIDTARRIKLAAEQIVADLGLPLSVEVDVQATLVVTPGRRLAWHEWRSAAQRFKRRLRATVSVGGSILLKSALFVEVRRGSR